jgi:hypothetical protein
VSWQAHLGGALAGVLAGLWLRHRDPRPPRRRYSWELEEPAAADDDALEPPRPVEVPVLWQRPTSAPPVVIPLHRKDERIH